jgi:hypothetical protein
MGRESSDQRENMDFALCEQSQVLWNELEDDLGALPPLEEVMLMSYDELVVTVVAEAHL